MRWLVDWALRWHFDKRSGGRRGGRGPTWAQSGGQVWDRAVVIQGRGPCGWGGIRRAHRIIFDARERLPRHAAHAAGRSRAVVRAQSPGCRAHGEERVRAGGASMRARAERAEATLWDSAWAAVRGLSRAVFSAAGLGCTGGDQSPAGAAH